MAHKLRIAIFLLILILCIITSISYVWLRVRQLAENTAGVKAQSGLITSDERAGLAPNDNSHGTLPTGDRGFSVSLPKSHFVIFRNTAVDNYYGQLSIVLLDALSQPRVPVGLNCERAYFANGYGVCLTAERGSITTHRAFIFDSSLKWRRVLPPLKGIPSRARVSPDGRYAAITVFVSGDSYSPGTFSTRVEIYRTDDGSRVAELEEFTVELDGKAFNNIDFNFWGVTFAADGDRFYATLATGGQNYLIEGELAARHARVIHAGVECPSLSPDGQRVAFKRLTKSGWHIYVLDLRTGAETPLAETRSVDDQVEWLDDNRVLYAFNNDIWVMPSDGSGTPTVFLANAYSPAVVR
jgi:hypothetical protein